ALGRDVRNCHPPESLFVVEEILDAFRKGERDSATFWVDIKEEKVLIQYFACRDGEGNYKGVVEVSQVISVMQSLTGEKRLLDWKK
ncbi:MAG TPA: PAS domain-containing protein, partial [Prolixibacteraceae bacterium]|nr:PAS domain-containing protein [Prolixibacteraceae bacterium]